MKKIKKVLKKKKIAAKRPEKKKMAGKKKTAGKKKVVTKKTVRVVAPFGKPIGIVTHFYNEISVAIVKFNKKVPVGTILHFNGATTDFKEPVKSMQFDHEAIAVAPKGKQIGIKVKKRVREGDKVYEA
jgi:hypothetical protein